MLASTALLVAASVSITFLAGPISDITDRAAQSAQDQSIYREAVLTGDPDNPTRRPEQFLEPTESGGGSDAQTRRPTVGEERTPDTTAVTTERVPAPASDDAENGGED